MLNTLNDIYQNYGISFVSSGYRDWYSDFYADPNTQTLAFLGIFSASDANPQSNAINLYILPPNNPVRGGKAKGTLPSPSDALFMGGTRPVQFNCAFRDYEIALTKVIAHEVGHCLGLNHTNRESDGDGDGLSDTPLDFNTNEACINPDNCQFVGPQFSGAQQCNPPCNTPSNPQTPYFSNVMAGNTLPQCMSQFSPMQAGGYYEE